MNALTTKFKTLVASKDYHLPTVVHHQPPSSDTKLKTSNSALQTSNGGASAVTSQNRIVRVIQQKRDRITRLLSAAAKNDLALKPCHFRLQLSERDDVSMYSACDSLRRRLA